MLFASSQLVHSLQLADFTAFVMDRWQLLRLKRSLSELDRTFLEIVSPLAKLFINIDSVQVHGWPNVIRLRDGMH